MSRVWILERAIPVEKREVIRNGGKELVSQKLQDPIYPDTDVKKQKEKYTEKYVLFLDGHQDLKKNRMTFQKI